jgi:large subunit ribosomal protein L4
MPVKKQEKKIQTKKIEVPVYDVRGKEVDKIILPSVIFNIFAVPSVIAQTIRVYLANQRLGTRDTKTRSQVTGSTRKIYKQKGTGRARHGDIKAPIFIGGGVAHGPKPKDFSLSLPKKMRRKALFSALTDALAGGKIKIVKGLGELPAKTGELASVFENLGLGKKKHVSAKTLLVLARKEENLVLAGRNIENVTIAYANQLHTYQIMTHKAIVFMNDAIKTLEDTFISEKSQETKNQKTETSGKKDEMEKTTKIVDKKVKKNPVEKKENMPKKSVVTKKVAVKRKK